MKLTHKQRLFILQFILILIFILIWTQLFNLQVLKSQGLITEARKQFYQRQISLRGDIRDRNGELLALDIVTYDLYNNVKDLKKIPQDKVINLAKIVRVTPEELTNKLSQRRNTKVFSGITETQIRDIKKNYLSIVYPVTQPIRTYPHKRMAAHLIGYVNQDRKGQYGVESSHNDLITKTTEYTNMAQLYPKGTDIALTIDSFLQEYAEEELTKAAIQAMASRGAIIALSPKTGEVYAWSVYPGFDPNLFYKEPSIKNWSITDIYEAGSTFKVITVSSALENMTINSTSTFFDPGFYKVGKRTIKNHGKTKPQNITLLELFKQSSNVASAQVGLTMKPEQFYNSIKQFMIGQKTNIDLPGESYGLLLDYKKWKTIDSATTAFGQGAVSVTPIQLACAISSVANHGIWIQPHVLKGIWDPTYMLIGETPKNIVSEQVISPETADLVSGLLRQSVKENVEAMSYIAGNVPGYEVAGKTGTAQKIRPDGKGYWGGHTVASFIGYFPAEDPKILILVVIDDPKTGGGWGNTVCGPVFNNVAKVAAKRLLKTHNNKEELVKKNNE